MANWERGPWTSAKPERNIITGMIVSDECLRGIIPIYKPDYFATPFTKTVAGWCVDFFNRFGQKPPLQHIKDMLESARRNGLDCAEADLIERFLSSISQEYEQQENFNIPFVLDQASQYFKRRSLQILQDELTLYLENNNIEAAAELVSDFKSIVRPGQDLGPGYTGPELLRATFTEPAWIVRGLLPQGFSPLCGSPKVGKSWLALNLVLSIATGRPFLGQFQVEQGEALYLDFELPDVKLKKRLKACLNGNYNLPGLENLLLRPKGSWPRIHQGGLDMLEEFVQEHPNLKLVVIDVWRKFSRPRRANEENSYNLTYEDVGPVKDFADRHGLCVLVIHHLAKGWKQYDSPFDGFLGSTAFAGASDNLFALVKGQGEADGVLWTTGRDIEDSQTALEFCREDCTWKYLGEAQHFELTVAQNEICQVLADNSEPMSPKEIAAAVGKPAANISEMLFRMVRQGRVEKVGYGKYTKSTITSISNNTTSNNTTISPITSLANRDRVQATPPENFNGYRTYSTFNGGGVHDPYGPEFLRKLHERGEESFRNMMALEQEIKS